jgi:hypothetical protein
MYSSKASLAGLVILTLLGGAPAAKAAELSLEGYFAGKTSAVGSFSAINGVKRQFTVELRGKWNGQTLTLIEDFVYSDGERDRKTWRFRKIAKPVSRHPRRCRGRHTGHRHRQYRALHLSRRSGCCQEAQSRPFPRHDDAAGQWPTDQQRDDHQVRAARRQDPGRIQPLTRRRAA